MCMSHHIIIMYMQFGLAMNVDKLDNLQILAHGGLDSISYTVYERVICSNRQLI